MVPPCGKSVPELKANEIAVGGRKGKSGNRKVLEPPVEVSLVDRAKDFGRKVGNAGHELFVERAGLDLILKFSHVSCRPTDQLQRVVGLRAVHATHTSHRVPEPPLLPTSA